MKQHVLGDRYVNTIINGGKTQGIAIIAVPTHQRLLFSSRLYKFQWNGVVLNVVSVFFVGSSAILDEGDSDLDEDETSGQALLGVLLVMAGALVQAMQFVFEEKVMTMVRCVLPGGAQVDE